MLWLYGYTLITKSMHVYNSDDDSDAAADNI